MRAREAKSKEAKHTSRHYEFPVVTRQEVELRLVEPQSIEEHGDSVIVTHGYATDEPTTSA